MSASIPTPFNFGRDRAAHDGDPLFDSNDESDGGTLVTGGGSATGDTKQGGGLPSNQEGVQFTVESGKAGIRYYFNSPPKALDFTQEKGIFIWAAQANAGNRRQLATAEEGGQSLKMYSGSDTISEIREWVLGGSNTKLATRTGIFLFAVDPESSGTDLGTGSFKPSNVLRYGHFTRHGNMIGTSTSWWIWCAAVLISSEKNSENIPRIYGDASSWQDLVDAVQGTTDFKGQNHIYVEKSGNTVNLFCPCAIGNASQEIETQTTFDDTGFNVISPSSADELDPRFHLTDDSMRFYIDLRDDSEDTATFSQTYNWGTQAPFDFSQSNSASIILSGATFTGMGKFTCGSSVSGNATFNLGGSNKVVIKGANLDGSTIKGDANVKGNAVTTFTDLHVTGVLNFDTAGTYNLDSCTINEIKNSSSSDDDDAITINLLNGSTVATNTGPNITILDLRNIFITGLSSGSRLWIYNNRTKVELFNNVVDAEEYKTTYSEDIGYSEGDELEIRVSKIDKLEFKRTLIVGANGWSQLVEQEDNLTYNAHAVDGAGVEGISWDSGDMQFDFEDPDNKIEGADIAAWYFYFITTEIGIREAFEAILWPQINIVTNRASVRPITFHNVKITPLVIKNCWISRDDGVSIIANISNNSIQIDPPTVFQVGLGNLESKVQKLVDSENADIFVTPTSFTKKLKGTNTVLQEKSYSTDNKGTRSLTEVTEVTE